MASRLAYKTFDNIAHSPLKLQFVHDLLKRRICKARHAAANALGKAACALLFQGDLGSLLFTQSGEGMLRKETSMQMWQGEEVTTIETG